MSKKIPKVVKQAFHLKSIELLKSFILIPSTKNSILSSFDFTIKLETKSDPLKKLLFVIVSIEVKPENKNTVLGAVTVSSIYFIPDFEDVIIIDIDGKLKIPTAISEKLNSTSISTTRGVLFSAFRGTFLHNAILPIID
jgi:hypothetical protein